MGLAWQQGPLAPGTIGHFLVPDPLPERLLYVEPLRRRLRVLLGASWIADSEHAVLLHEPGRYPVAYFPLTDIAADVLQPTEHVTQHRDLGATSWYTVRVGEQSTPRAAWQHTGLPAHGSALEERVAFAWRAMDGFYEEEERIVGHAADSYHRIDIRQTSRHLLVRDGDQVIADSTCPLVLYESGFAPRWYVPRADVDESALTPVEGQTFCPYKGLASYYDIGDAHRAVWSYEDAWDEVRRIAGLLSFEPDKISVDLDGTRLRLAPGQSVMPHGVDRNLTVDDAQRIVPAEATSTSPDPVAVSPAIGPIPPTLVRRSPGDATSTPLLVPAAVRVARLAGGWARRHFRWYDLARLASKPAGHNTPMVAPSAVQDDAEQDVTVDEATPAPQRFG